MTFLRPWDRSQTATKRAEASGASWTLGDLSLDVSARELVGPKGRARLQEKPFRVLMGLLESGGQVVTRSELHRRLWPDDIFVDYDSGLNTAVRKLRDLLGACGGRPRSVQTIPKVGYRWVGPRPSRRPAGTWTTRRTAAGLLVAALGVWAVITQPGPDSARKLPIPAFGEAWQAYVDGKYLAAQPTVAARRAAARSFERAIAVAPDFTVAHAALAETYLNLTLRGAVAPDQVAQNARRAARLAVSTDSGEAVAHLALGRVKLLIDWDLSGAEADLRRALKLNPKSAAIHDAIAGIYLATERFDAAVEAKRRAVDLDPASYRLKADLGYYLLVSGRIDEAIRETRQALELEPSYLPSLSLLVEALGRMGRLNEALNAARRTMTAANAEQNDLDRLNRAAGEDVMTVYQEWRLERTRRLVQEGRAPQMRLAAAHMGIGDSRGALSALRESLRRREGFLIYLKADPEFRPLRQDPEFREIIDRIGFPST